MAFQLSDNLRQTVADGVRFRHPDYDEATVQLAVQRICLPDHLFRKIHPDSQIEV